MSDAVLLAWAAGFFDAEGSTVVRLAGATRERAYMRAQIPQSDRCGGREVLERFRAAVNGTGSISEPDAEGVQCFYTTSTLPTIVVMRLLLPQLGLVKRTQLRDCAATTMAALRTVRRPGGPTGITRMQLGDSLSALIRDLEQTNLGPFGQLEEQLG